MRKGSLCSGTMRIRVGVSRAMLVKGAHTPLDDWDEIDPFYRTEQEAGHGPENAAHASAQELKTDDMYGKEAPLSGLHNLKVASGLLYVSLKIDARVAVSLAAIASWTAIEPMS